MNSIESLINHVYSFGLQFKQMNLIVMKQAKARYIIVSCQCILTSLVFMGKKYRACYHFTNLKSPVNQSSLESVYKYM